MWPIGPTTFQSMYVYIFLATCYDVDLLYVNTDMGKSFMRVEKHIVVRLMSFCEARVGQPVR